MLRHSFLAQERRLSGIESCSADNSGLSVTFGVSREAA